MLLRFTGIGLLVKIDRKVYINTVYKCCIIFSGEKR